jgi:hypothetical protein
MVFNATFNNISVISWLIFFLFIENFWIKDAHFVQFPSLDKMYLIDIILMCDFMTCVLMLL